jgi:hypothetical protein
VFEFRITKYDPRYRDAQCVFTRDEWISRDDIGHSFSGVTLTEAEYQRVEDAYVATALAFLREAGIGSLAVHGLENHHSVPIPVEIGAIVRHLLRGEFWCRLEAADAFVHIGYDYYMYIGVGRACPVAEKLAGQLGLFVEEFSSPYRENR